MNRRRLVLLAAALVALSAITGVGSVSSTATNRTVSVAVASDSSAYLGIEFGEVDNGTRALTVYNRVSTDDVEVTVDGDSTTAGPGDPATFTVDCGSVVSISAVGPTVQIEATRSVVC